MRDVLIRGNFSCHSLKTVLGLLISLIFLFLFNSLEKFLVTLKQNKNNFVMEHFATTGKNSNYEKSRFCAIMQIIPITAILFKQVFAKG